jgi:DNA gyrase inhibitor GyrI
MHRFHLGVAVAWAMTIQPNGKIVAAGEVETGRFALARYRGR